MALLEDALVKDAFAEIEVRIVEAFKETPPEKADVLQELRRTYGSMKRFRTIFERQLKDGAGAEAEIKQINKIRTALTRRKRR